MRFGVNEDEGEREGEKGEGIYEKNRDKKKQEYANHDHC